MRQLSSPANLLLACVAAVALVASLSLPWYAPSLPVGDPDVGAVERAAAQVAHVFAHAPSATSGADALGGTRDLVLALAAAVVALCAGVAAPALRAALRDVLRAVALAEPPLVAYLVVARPGGATGDLHWGALVSLAIGAILASAAWHGSGIRVKRPAPGAWARTRTR